MADYNLGRATGKIEIDYDGSGADKAAKDLDKVAAANERADASMSKTQGTLKDTEKEFDRAGTSAEGYSKKIHETEEAHTGLHTAQGKSNSDLQDFSQHAQKAENAATGMSKAVRDVAGAAEVLQPELAGASELIDAFAEGLGRKIGGAIGGSGQSIRDFAKHVAGLEASFAKIGGLSLGVPSLGALGGLAGAAGTKGIVEIVDAVRQLSGVLGELPAIISGVGFSLGTLKVAFHGVGQAVKDMMADDPKKFLNDIKEMGPAAAQAMLGVAQFRNQFKLAGATVQDSFFKQIAGDIAPLIQTWLPAITDGMSKISGVFGQAADQFAKLLMQPQAMQAFQQFIGNLAAGLQSLQPAMGPLLDVFTRLTTVGSSFFSTIGRQITTMIGFFDQIVAKAESSGQLQNWIISGINAFGHLVNTMYSVGAAFGNIMSIADRFGNGGLLGFIDKITQQLNAWTQSAAGQQALASFFQTLNTATNALLPVLPQLFNGFVSLAGAFVQLGVATAPGQQTFFEVLAATMQNLAPIIVQMAPALNTFMTGLAQGMQQLMQSVGPQLPTIFSALANAFVALIPQVQPLVNVFVQLIEQVGPQLPKFFGAITDLIQASLPFWPLLIGLVRDFVSAVTWFVGAGRDVISWFAGFLGGVKNFASQVPTVFGQVIDGITGFFKNLPGEALQWGKDLINGFIDGIKSLEGDVEHVVKSITDHIPQVVKDALGISSPSKVFYEIGVNTMQGLQGGLAAASASAVAVTATVSRQLVDTMSSGLAGVGAAAAGAAGASSLGGAPAPAAGGSDTTGQALLPDNIASADVSILRAYQKHQFDPKRGLKGLAASLGQGLQLAQTGFNLMNQYVAQNLMTGLGLLPGAKDKSFRKMTPAEQAAQLRDNAAKDADKGPTWGDVLGQGSPGAATAPSQTPLGLTPTSSKDDIQKAIIAAGKQRGLSDAAIQTALAVAADESGFNAASPTQTQGGHPVGGLFQQGPAFGTTDQALDPNHAINAFYNAYAQQLQKNPNNPLLAATLTQNPQLGAAAQGSDYMNAVAAHLGLAGSILNAPGNKDITGPTWAQLTPGGAPSAIPGAALASAAVPGLPVAPPDKIKVGADGSISVPPGYSLPPTSTAGGAISANPSSRASTLGGAKSNYTPSTMAAAGIAPLFTKSAPGSMAGAPAWVNQLASAFGLTATDHPDTTLHGGEGQMGSWAFDFGGSVENMQKFADFIKTNLSSQTLQAIWQNPQTGSQLGIAGGQILGPGQYYTTAGGTYADHQDHVHWATDVAPLFNGQMPPGSMLAGAQSASGSPSGSLLLPDGKTIAQDTSKSATANQALLQAYLRGNPQLAQQISAAQQPGASDTVVLGALNGIGKTIDGLKQQDAVGNKETIDALSSTQSSIASQQGYTSGQSTLSSVSGGLGSVGNAITGGFQIAQAVLDAMSATQDIADRVVYGIANTEDVMKIVDDSQKYLTVAASIANETGNVLNTVGQFAAIGNVEGGFVGGGGGIDPGQIINAVGSIAYLVAGGIQGVNSLIDYGQQIYEISMGYLGQFMSYLTAGPGGTPLMGNVQYMLNTNTGQLITSSLDNPQLQNQLGVPSFLQGLYGMGNSASNTNPGVGALNIYAGPGQSPAEMMNEAMWQVNTGNVGAAVAANF